MHRKWIKKIDILPIAKARGS